MRRLFTKIHLSLLLCAFTTGFCLQSNGHLAAQTMDLLANQAPLITSDLHPAIDTIGPTLPNIPTDRNASTKASDIAWVFKIHPLQALLRGSYFLVAERFWNQNKYAVSLGLGFTRNAYGLLSSVDVIYDPLELGFPEYFGGGAQIRTGFYSQLTLKRYIKAYRFGPRQGTSYIGLHQLMRTYNWTTQASLRDNNGNPIRIELKEQFFEYQFCPVFGRSWVKSNGFFIDLFVGLGLFVWQSRASSGSSFLNPGWSDADIYPLPRLGMAFGLTRFRD